jgi:acyl-CoA thioesterase-1
MRRLLHRLCVRYGAGRRRRNLWLALPLVLLALPGAAQPVTVAALGDSLTQGYGLPEAEGFVPQLGRWLADRGHDAVILNAGVSGDTTAGGLSRTDWTLTPEVDALIVTLGGNDLLRGIDPAVSRANLAGILDKAAARGVPVLLIGLDAPANYGADYQSAFDAIYPDLAEAYGTLYVSDFLAPLVDAAGSRPAALARYMQPDGIHPNAAGVAVIVDAIGPAVADLVARAGP